MAVRLHGVVQQEFKEFLDGSGRRRAAIVEEDEQLPHFTRLPSSEAPATAAEEVPAAAAEELVLAPERSSTVSTTTTLDARSPLPLLPLFLKSSKSPRFGGRQNAVLAFRISKLSSRDTKRGRGRVGVVVEAKVAEKLPKSAMIEGRQLPTTTDGDIGIYGAIAPFENGFDPLGLSRRIPWEDLKRYREAELTHGCVCMLAAVGILVGEYVEGSSFLFDASITGPAINHFQQVPPPFWYALGVAIFVAEATRVQKGWADPFTSDLFTLREDYVPGEIGFDPLGLCPDSSDELYLDYKLKELSHGRLAMIATAWFVCKELITGNKIFPQFDLFPYQ